MKETAPTCDYLPTHPLSVTMQLLLPQIVHRLNTITNNHRQGTLSLTTTIRINYYINSIALTLVFVLR